MIVMEQLLVWAPVYSVSLTFKYCGREVGSGGATAVVLIKNHVLLLVPYGKVLELGFLKCI